MKNYLLKSLLNLLIIVVIIGVTGCSTSEPPEMSYISGYWKIHIGNEYSMNVKDIIINITDTGMIYDNILLPAVTIENNRVIASKEYISEENIVDSIFSVDLKLTYKENYLVGYEITQIGSQLDSVYVFGSRFATIKVEPPVLVPM